MILFYLHVNKLYECRRLSAASKLNTIEARSDLIALGFLNFQMFLRRRAIPTGRSVQMKIKHYAILSSPAQRSAFNSEI